MHTYLFCLPLVLQKNTKEKCSGISCTFRENIYREYDS